MQVRAHALELARTRLAATDPDAPLARGYAIVLHDGRLVRRPDQVRPGDPIEARLQHGMLDARVERVTHDE